MKKEKRPVVIGEYRPSPYNPVMTREAALRYANAMMPADLKRAGFIASIFESDMQIHGGLWYRINYSKKC